METRRKKGKVGESTGSCMVIYPSENNIFNKKCNQAQFITCREQGESRLERIKAI